MRAPIVRAALERRILVNYRVDPTVIETLLPEPFRPVLISGYAIAGLCLIRLGRIHPAGLPAIAGLRTENAAHRFAVEWDTPAGPGCGVYIPRRDTNSAVIAMVGGRIFPGWHHRAVFDVAEGEGRLAVRVHGAGAGAQIHVSARLAGHVMPGSVFADLDSASRFFRCAPVGYSARRDGAGFDGVRLDSSGWNLQPLAIDEVTSGFFGDTRLFPAGSIALDSAFLMRDLATTWSPLPRLAGRPVRRPVSEAGVRTA